MTVHVEPIDAGGLSRYAAVAATIYGAAMQRSPEVVVQRREVITSHLRNPGLVAALARRTPDTDDTAADDDAASIVGFGYGYRGVPGQWWYDVVARALGRDQTRQWLRDGFELAELHVLPDHQGAGAGSALLDDILARTDARHVLLSTPDAESRARRLYRSRGFVDLLRGFHFPGSSEAYAVMACEHDLP